MDDSGSGIYRIGAVSRMLGADRATLGNWEEHFGIVVPQRSAGGQRLFSRGDLDKGPARHQRGGSTHNEGQHTP